MIILPESYDIMLETGHGMWASRWLIGTSWALPPVTIVALTPFIGTMSECAKKWTCVAAAGGLSVAGPDAFALPLCLLAQSVTPGPEMVLFMIWLSLAISVGVGLGPISSSLANTLVGSTGTSERAAVPVLGLSAAWLGMLVLVALVWPASTESLEMDKKAGQGRPSAPSGPTDGQCQKIERLSSGARRALRWNSLFYGTEQALIIVALEAATVAILEAEFGWSTGAAGYVASCAYLASIPIALLAKYGLHAGWITGVTLLLVSSGLACTSITLIFPAVGGALASTGVVGAVLLLASDCVAFAAGSLASGMMQGFGLRSSEQNAFASEVNFTAASFIFQNGVSRLVGPSIRRWCESQGGRPLYAAVQCLVSASGFATCLLVSAETRFPKA